MMETQTQDAVIACTLTDQEFKTRRALARKTIVTKVVAYDYISNGLKLSFSNSAETRAQVEEFIELEKGCCGFLSFDLAPAPVTPTNPIELVVTGPPGSSKFTEIFVDMIKEAEAGEYEKIAT